MLSLNWFVISVNDLEKKNPHTHSSLPEGTLVCYWETFPKSEMSLASYFLEVKSPGKKFYIRYTGAQDNHSDE